MLVSSLDSNILDFDFGVERVWLKIHHSAVRDLAIYLMSPDGTTVELCSGNGGLGDDFDSTVFDGVSTRLITMGIAPFRDAYLPEHSLGLFNNGQLGNGVWRLLVADYVAGDTGSVLEWGIVFSDNPVAPLSFSSGPCQDYDGRSCMCPDSGIAPCSLLPDMIISETMLKDTFWRRETTGLLRVTNSCANIGYGPMELEGTGRWKCGDSLVSGPILCPDGNWSKQELKQRIWKKTSGPLFDFEDTLVGAMQFHADLGHRHLHIDDWAQNTIRIKGPETDPSQWPVIASGKKVSFCVYDHLQCGDAFYNCVYEDSLYYYSRLSNRGLGTGYDACGALIQGISVGYSDVYDWTLEGQEIPLDSLCNGKYYLVAELDPKHLFRDLNRNNNVSVVEIELRNQIAGCCKSSFRIDTIDKAENIYQFVSLAIPAPDSVLWEIGDLIRRDMFPVFDFEPDSQESFTIRLHVFSDGCRDSISRQVHLFPDACVPEWIGSLYDFKYECYLTDSLRFMRVNTSDVSPNANYLKISPFHHLFTSKTPAEISVKMLYETEDSNGCIYGDTLVYYADFSKVEVPDKKSVLLVYPNPVYGNEFIIDFSIWEELPPLTIRIFDLQGREVSSYNHINGKIIEKKVVVPIKDEMRGLYLLQVETEKSIHVGKISKI